MPILTPQDMQAIWLSVKVSATATLLATPFGFGTACLLTYGRLPGKTLLEGILNLPLVLPPVVVGYLLLLSFGAKSPLGTLLARFGLRVIFTPAGAVLASAVVGFPLLVRAIRLGLESIDHRYLQAARTLGATRLDTLLTIVIPLSGRALLAGMVLMFARSLGEFGATIVVAGNIPGVTQTVPLAIYDSINTPAGDQHALTLCLISIAISLAVLLFSEAAARKHRPAWRDAT